MCPVSINWLDSLGNACAWLTDGTRLLQKTSRRVEEVVRMDPDPSYDFSDELEFFFNYFTWGFRGVVDGNGYPPPAYPPV